MRNVFDHLGRNVFIWVICILFFSFSDGFSQKVVDPISNKKEDASVPKESMQGVEKLPPAASFHPQFGLGITFVPIQQFWFFDWTPTYYQAGLQLDFLFRLHRRVTLEISMIGTGNGSLHSSGQEYAEFSGMFGPRIYLWVPKDPEKVRVVPYLVTGLHLSTIITSLRTDNNTSAPGTLSVAGYAGGFLGIGFELRISPRIVLVLDARGTVQAEAMSFLGHRAGLRVNTGINFFF